jgi:hypothetical protein
MFLDNEMYLDTREDNMRAYQKRWVT